jgi:hydrogenase expression/formation protein HypC
MCLAVPAQVVEADGDQALVDLQGNRLRISTALTPHVAPGEWVLVHAGFAITTVDERDALETWDYLRGTDQPTVLAGAGAEPEKRAAGPPGGP